MNLNKNDNQADRWLKVLIKTGYNDSQEILKEFSIVGNDVAMPKDVEAKILESLSGQQIEVIGEMKRPVFLMVPVSSGNRYLKTLDKWVGTQEIFQSLSDDVGDIIKGEIDSGVTLTYVYPSDWGQGALQRLEERNKIEGDQIVGWKWAIIEGVSEIVKPDDSEEILRSRLGNFDKKYASKNVTGIGLYEYMLLVMESIKNKQVIDQNTWTVINNEPLHNDSVAGGYFDAGYAYLQMSIVGVPYPSARFRPMVSGSF